eukprot:15406-Heterococcus_DN1.PRE.1
MRTRSSQLHACEYRCCESLLQQCVPIVLYNAADERDWHATQKSCTCILSVTAILSLIVSLKNHASQEVKWQQQFAQHTPPHALVTIKLVPSAHHALTACFAQWSADILHACNLVILAESRTLCANRHTHTTYRSAAQCFSELQRAQSSRRSRAVMQAFQQYFHEKQATLTLSVVLPKFASHTKYCNLLAAVLNTSGMEHIHHRTGFVLDTELRDLLGHDRNISKFNKTETSLCQYSSKQVEKILQLASRTWKPDSTMRQHYLMEAHIVGGQQ